MTDVIRDDGQSQQAQPFVFPEDPQSAQITFTITVEDPPSHESGEETSGEGLRMSAVLEPGGATLQHGHLVTTFDRAPFSWSVGTYVLRSDASGTQMLRAPAGFAKNDWQSIVDRLKTDLEEWRGQLASGLESFPGVQTIRAIARDVVGLITIASLKHLAFTSEPVADARHAKIVGVDCVSCDFGRVLRLQNLLSELLGAKFPARNEDVREIDGVRFLVDQKDESTVEIGYLSHHNAFAPLLNAELARRVHDAIAQIADEVVLEIAARNEAHRRLCASSGLSLHRTYALDSETLARRVLELEAEALEAFTGSESHETQDDDPVDEEDGENWNDSLHGCDPS